MTSAGRWRVQLVCWPSRQAFLRGARVADPATNALYVPRHRLAGARPIIGTVHIHRGCDVGTVAHECFHVVMDTWKLRGNRPLTMPVEEESARLLAQLVRRTCDWFLRLEAQSNG